MFKTRKIVVLFLLFALLAFNGCRTKDYQPREDYSGIELTYYKVFDDTEVMEPLINEYIADHPGLKINYRQFSDFDEYQKTILNEMAEGEGPDIFSMQNTWFAANYRKLVPMPETLGFLPRDFESVFVETAYKDLVRPDDDGQLQIYALPMTVDTLALYYNKDHFEDRLPEQGVPSATWDGIKNDVIRLNRRDNSFSRFEVSGIAMGRADNITRAVDILYLLFLQYGANFYNSTGTLATFATAHGVGASTTFPALEALKLFLSFADEDNRHYSWNEQVADDDLDNPEIRAFAEGKVSMIIGYAYTYDLILNEIALARANGGDVIDKNSIRTAPIPQLEDPELANSNPVTYASYFAETVSKNTEYPELAWDFLAFLASKKSLEEYFDATHNPTSRRDMIGDQRKDPIYGVFADQIGIAESFPIIEYYRYREIFENVINNSQVNTSRGTLVDAQDTISEMLPPEGLFPPVKETTVPEEDE